MGESVSVRAAGRLRVRDEPSASVRAAGRLRARDETICISESSWETEGQG